MIPRVLDLRWDPRDGKVLQEVARHLRAEGLVAMPTETVYGLGGRPEGGALLRLQELKGRTEEKPFLLLIPSADFLADTFWPAKARKLAEVFWPGALTLVLPDITGAFPPGVRSREGGVAVRQSPHPLVRLVLEALGGPLVSTSANSPGGAPAHSAEEALSVAMELGAGEELWVLDGGTLGPSEPSTIVDCTGPEPVVLRSGALPTRRLRCVLPEIHESR